MEEWRNDSEGLVDKRWADDEGENRGEERGVSTWMAQDKTRSNWSRLNQNWEQCLAGAQECVQKHLDRMEQIIIIISDH